jgi:hypothetical protein
MRQSFAVLSLVVALGSSMAFAQESAEQSQKHKHHHHKKGFFLGMCVGQSLLVANPPVALTVGKKPTKDQWTAIKGAKKACIAAFKAAKGGSSLD